MATAALAAKAALSWLRPCRSHRPSRSLTTEKTQSIYVEEDSRDAFVVDYDEDGVAFWRQIAVNLVDFEIAALASIRNPLADSTDGLHVLLSDPVAVEEVPTDLGAHRQSNDADLQNSDIFLLPGETLAWHVPPVGPGRPTSPVSNVVAYYDNARETLGWANSSNQYFEASGLQEGFDFFNPEILWLDVGTTNTDRFAAGTGRFAGEAAAEAYMRQHHAVFTEHYDAGIRQVAYFNTTHLRVDVADIDNIGALGVPAAVTPEPVPSTESTDAEIAVGGAWATPRVLPAPPASPVPFSVFYLTEAGSQGLRYFTGSDPAPFTPASNSSILAGDVTWLHVAAGRFAAGTGRFATDDAAIIYILTHDFSAETAAGRTRYLFFRTSDSTLRVLDDSSLQVDIATIASFSVPGDSVESTDADMREVWSNPRVAPATPQRRPQFSREIWYRTLAGQERLIYLSGPSTTSFVTSDADAFDAPDLTWLHVRQGRYSVSGTGRFATDADAKAYLLGNDFSADIVAGLTRFMFFRTSDGTLRTLLAQLSTLPLVSDNEEGNDWQLRGRQRYTGRVEVPESLVSSEVVDGDLAGGATHVWNSPVVVDNNPAIPAQGPIYYYVRHDARFVGTRGVADDDLQGALNVWASPPEQGLPSPHSTNTLHSFSTSNFAYFVTPPLPATAFGPNSRSTLADGNTAWLTPTGDPNQSGLGPEFDDAAAALAFVAGGNAPGQFTHWIWFDKSDSTLKHSNFNPPRLGTLRRRFRRRRHGRGFGKQ